MGWIAFLKLFLQIANSIAKIVQEKRLMDAGEAKQIAKVLVEISQRAGIAKEVEEETAKMSAEEILAELESEGELRP